MSEQVTSQDGSSSSNISFSLSHRGHQDNFLLDRHASLGDLHEIIYDRTRVLPQHQKIVAAGRLRKVFAGTTTQKGGDGGENDGGEEGRQTLDQLGFFAEMTERRNAPLKLMLVGPREEEVESVRREDELATKRNAPRNYHPSLLKGTRPRNTGGLLSSSTTNPFASLRVHPNTPASAPEYDLVMSRLQQLSRDEAIVHVCRLHGFTVGELTELLPHEHPNLLGLNENMGQRISLRLRTDRYDGLTAYREVRRVLLHELAHNKVNDHPPEFKTLNSLLNAQVEAFERAKKEGTHSLLGHDDVYIPSDVGQENETPLTGSTTNILGGGTVSSSNLSSELPRNAADRRARVLEATMKRLEKAEAEIERGCGSAL